MSRLRRPTLPSVSPLLLLQANPIFLRKWARVKSSSLSLLSFLGATFLASASLVAAGYSWASAQIDQDLVNIRSQVTAEVSARAEKQALIKIMSDQNYVNRVCTEWWFNTSGVPRKPPSSRR